MRSVVIAIVVGLVVGIVLGIVAGTTVIAPRLASTPAGKKAPGEETPAAEITKPEKEATKAAAPAALPEPPVHWRMASAYAADLPHMGTLAKRIERTIWRVSGGGMEIKFHAPGVLVPRDRTFEAVASGTIEAAFSAPAAWGDRVPALYLFSSVPFGPPPTEYLAWMDFGGGKELLRKILRKRGIHGLVCGIIAPEASGWFRQQIRVLEDFKGLRMGVTGLAAKVLAKLGVETHALAPGDIFMAFESGAIDGAEFSMPAVDLKLGLDRMANHYYFPGWHQPATLLDLIINQDAWDALSPKRKSQIEAVCGDNTRYGLAEGEALQFTALKELSAKGVQVHRWPPEILEALRKAWQDVAGDMAGGDADFKRVWQSLTEFRRDYAIWQELARP